MLIMFNWFAGWPCTTHWFRRRLIAPETTGPRTCGPSIKCCKAASFWPTTQRKFHSKNETDLSEWGKCIHLLFCEQFTFCASCFICSGLKHILLAPWTGEYETSSGFFVRMVVRQTVFLTICVSRRCQHCCTERWRFDFSHDLLHLILSAGVCFVHVSFFFHSSDCEHSRIRWRERCHIGEVEEKEQTGDGRNLGSGWPKRPNPFHHGKIRFPSSERSVSFCEWNFRCEVGKDDQHLQHLIYSSKSDRLKLDVLCQSKCLLL